jgi:deoxyribodipyrimidine photo-lyase
MERAIWWIRRDLRLADNPALAEAIKRSGQIIPLFILDPALLDNPDASKKRLAFLYGGLLELDARLKNIGSRLIIRRGKPVEVLAQLTEEAEIKGIYAEADYSFYARRRDAKVAASLPLSLIASTSVRHPTDVVKDDGSAYTVFTPYMKAWKKRALPGQMDLIAIPERIDTPEFVTGDPFPELDKPNNQMYFIPGEEEANRRLERFTMDISGGIFRYADQRNRMDLDGTSGLSPYLRFGMLSARQAVVAAWGAEQLAQNREEENSVDTWLNEIIWREFYIAILYHFPEVSKMSFRPEYRHIQWRNDATEFDAWKNGVTGYPVVDAGMRQLATMGWMHNRARMITASFLVKDLLVDWQNGEAHFMSLLVDGDPAVNNGSWQWTAGTGTDAAPYFRIFNPILQGQKFDPLGNFIRRWVPELQAVPTEYIHQPWLMPAAQQKLCGCIIGKNYPHPIVDHRVQRDLALAMYGRK